MATLVVFVACNRGEQPGGTTSASKRSEPQPITRVSCTEGNAQTVDVNNDGKPDITHRTSGGKRVCSEVDLNFDGRPDVTRFYESDGTTVKFEQHDYDFDGKVDDSVFYASGKVERKELDTNFDGLIDTWLWCKGSLVSTAERARRKPGRVDTWETYEDGLLAEVRYDENNDGVVEKWDHYKNGSLFESQIDSNMDGKPDRTDSAAGEGEDADAERVSCDGTTLPALPAPGSGGSVFSPDGGVITTAVTLPSVDGGVAPRVLPPIPSDAGTPALGSLTNYDAGVPKDAGKGDAAR